MRQDILDHLDANDVWYSLESELDAVIRSVDVVYLTQIRPGRLKDQKHLSKYVVDSSILKSMKSDAMILHPLPRTLELDKTVDSDPRAFYFQQATNGLYVRMALLTMLLE